MIREETSDTLPRLSCRDGKIAHAHQELYCLARGCLRPVSLGHSFAVTTSCWEMGNESASQQEMIISGLGSTAYHKRQYKSLSGRESAIEVSSSDASTGLFM